MKETPNLLHLSAAQVAATVEASGLSRGDFAAVVGCGTSQLFKYQKEGLPPRMNSEVRAALLEQAVQYSIVPSNAARREAIRKLKGA
jgi:hypothetical protein